MTTHPLSRSAPWWGALMGTLFAVWLYGWKTIDPAAALWLLQGDPAQHYLGSVYFLNEPWHWPPGLITRFGDAPTSVVFTDAIPLVALPAKLFGLSAGLQYFGLWMVLCHALSGWFGMRLLQRVGVRGIAAAAGTLLFVMSPAMLMRVYGHEALMAHFLVLAALERALAPWRWRGWLVLTAVAVLIHPYLAAMVALLGGGAGAVAVLERRVSVGRLVGEAAISAGVLFALAWCAGYFVGSGQLSAPGHGVFSSNLLTWLDPMDWVEFNRRYSTQTSYSREWSRFLPALKQATGGQYEGFAYLGAGMLLLVVLAAIGWLGPRLAGAVTPSAGEPDIPPLRWIFASVVCLALALLAISARPSFGAHIIAEIPLWPTVERALGVFRASGRFIWPLTYLLMAWTLMRVRRWPRGIPLILLAFALQVADLNGKLKEFRGRFRHGPPQLSQPVASPLWAAVLRNCPNLWMVSEAHPGAGWVGPALAAGLAQARFFPAPTARFSPEAEAQRVAAVRQLLRDNAWQRDTLYLLAAPLPPEASIGAIKASLPAGVRYERADDLDLVFHESCAKG